MIPVILSGGGGTRLWPVSRQSFPKQFCDLLDESLFNKTAKRLMPLGDPWVITTREMQLLTESALTELGLPSGNTIYEPHGMNTAAAVALVCHRMVQLGKAEEVVGIFPADHLIEDASAFRASVSLGEKLARQGSIVTLGIAPTHAASGYGYIETVDSKQHSPAAGAVSAIGFREKPSEQVAQEYLSKGGYYWNAGMFIFSVQTMVRAFIEYAPDIWRTISKVKHDMSNIDEIYRSVRSTSIDYAIMERLPAHVCIPCAFGWTDLGSWDAAAEILAPTRADLREFSINSSSNFIQPIGNKIYGLVGVDNLIIVDTEEALLIANRGDTELVKQLVDKIRNANSQGGSL